MASVLLIDDNPEILFANCSHLTEQGFDVTAVDTGIRAMAALSEKQFDCIVLDILLPDLDGYAICKAARTVTDAPVIFLTCLDEVDDKIRGLMSGGDDYMTKPYSLDELTARVRAMLRRGTQISRANFFIDYKNRMIHAKDQNAFLSEKEFELFALLYKNPGVVFSNREILEQVWKDLEKNASTVSVYISRLRKKIDFATDVLGSLENGYGEGYCLTPPETEDNP